MSAIRRAGAIATMAAAAFAAAGQSQAPVFRTSTEAVIIDVAVLAGNKPVVGLGIGDFEITDNGIPQTLVDLTRETMPIDISLIVDTSGSMRGLLFNALRKAIDDVAARIRADDTMRLVQFSERVGVGEAISPRPGQKLSTQLRVPDGYTSFLDAVAMGLISEPRPGRREMAIVLTDGWDTTSIVSEDAVIELAKRSNAAVFAVALVATDTSVPAHERLLKTVTGLSGGRLAVLPRNQDLSRAFVQALDDFRTSYVVRYEPKGVERRGWHDVSVTIRNQKNYTVRARKGYVGG